MNVKQETTIEADKSDDGVTGDITAKIQELTLKLLELEQRQILQDTNIA